MKKRICGILLMLCMVLVIVPTVVLAEGNEIETVQTMLDALPTVEELEAAEEATVNAAYEAAQDAYDALEALNPEEQEQITGAEKLMTLMKWFNEKTSMTDGVEYNHNNVHGIEPGKTYCGDTYFTVDIPAEHLVRVSYYHEASRTYPVLTPDEDGRYKLDAGLGQIAVCVDWYVKGGHAIDFDGITINADHVDIDKDHNCDNGCGKTVGTHEDTDLNHICDYGCKERIGTCADADKDHKCDYGCGKDFGTHEDADLNHICDYGCKETIGICADADKDHKCDYGCGKDFGTCEDADKNHKCDYGCGKTFGVCSGGTATCKDKAVCDYCGKPYGELDSSNHAGGTEVRNAKDAKCTEDGYTGDTYCKGCSMKLQDGKPITKLGHIDADKNHVCDREYCKATLSNHDFGEDGKCECGAVQYTVTFDVGGGTVDPTSATTDTYGKLSSLPTPTRKNYNFLGWFLKDGTPVDTDTVFTEHTTVYAHWQIKSSALLPTWQQWELIDKIVAANKKNETVEVEPEPEETEPTETEPVEEVEPTQVETTWENPFTDVAETDAFYEAVKFAYKNGFMNGMSSYTFAPSESLTRAMLVTVLYRAAGSPVMEDANPFVDVAEDAWYYNAVVWAKSIGLVTGITETEFAPEDEITREQLVTIFYRYAMFLGHDVSIGEDTNILSYEDFADIAEYAIPAMQWACGANLIEGVDGNILPKDNATRALVAMVLYGFYA